MRATVSDSYFEEARRRFCAFLPVEPMQPGSQSARARRCCAWLPVEFMQPRAQAARAPDESHANAAYASHEPRAARATVPVLLSPRNTTGSKRPGSARPVSHVVVSHVVCGPSDDKRQEPGVNNGSHLAAGSGASSSTQDFSEAEPALGIDLWSLQGASVRPQEQQQHLQLQNHMRWSDHAGNQEREDTLCLSESATVGVQLELPESVQCIIDTVGVKCWIAPLHTEAPTVKTILVWAGRNPVAVVAPLTSSVQLEMVAQVMGLEASDVRIVGYKQVTSVCGFPVGTVPAFGHLPPMHIIVDQHSSAAEQRIVCACGVREHVLVTTWSELLKYPLAVAGTVTRPERVSRTRGSRASGS
eukprot:TRINITY_DN94701_c0_g1_i1.p1 TRINITY_DN94701_c0_g1~~TRINITY_DN94701_c0_g1_i1.p1  ORF type:complete len:358 (-),score=36.09 TRINITY_DN94701_c0_g1_i1:49-1122(-)